MPKPRDKHDELLSNACASARRHDEDDIDAWAADHNRCDGELDSRLGYCECWCHDDDLGYGT